MASVRKYALLISFAWWAIATVSLIALLLFDLPRYISSALGCFFYGVIAFTAVRLFVGYHDRVRKASEMWRLSLLSSIAFGIISMLSFSAWALVIMLVPDWLSVIGLNNIDPSEYPVDTLEIIFIYIGALMLSITVSRIAFGIFNFFYASVIK